MRVSGEGPRPCHLMLVGEFPGPEEGKRGRPFIGKSGRELMRYFNGLDLPLREATYLTNFSKTVAPEMKASTVSESDLVDLQDELDSVLPRTVVTLGARVTQWFLGDDATLEAVHGIPHTSAKTSALIFPTYNPAAMLHSPGLQAVFAYDMRRLSLHLKRKLPPVPKDERAGNYALYPPGNIWTSLRSLIAVDTEGWRHLPWCISYSEEAYKGEVVRYGNHENFVNSVRANKPRVVIHNSLHDLDVLRAFGLDVDDDGVPFEDTMVMAYLLGLEPQGLKALAYRHAGMHQREYTELTGDAQELITFNWLAQLHDSLPDKAEKLTKKQAVALGIIPDTREKYEPISWPPQNPMERELAKVKGLIARMLVKPGGLTKRWQDGRSREILVEELYHLSPGETDPPEATLDDVPLKDAVTYAGRDADATLRVYPYLSTQIDRMELRDVYEVDRDIIPMIDRMQTTGLAVDVSHMVGLSQVFEIEEQMALEAIAQAAGRDVNPNSGDQVAEWIYDELRLHEAALNLRIKRTKSGDRLSTNDKTLEALSELHPAVKLIQEAREIRKLRGTYTDPIRKLVQSDGRLHPRYRITRTDTGRLSAADPNVLALPKHSRRGKLVRMGFIAGEGHELGEWDLSQIEMCVFAHDSGDENMIGEIRSGIDKHASTASRIFGRPADLIYQEYKHDEGEGPIQRFAAKAVNFGILMGITEFGLLDQFHKNKQLQYDLSDMEKLLSDWFKSYPQAKQYIEGKHAEARRQGFVRDMWGRLRWLEGIHSHDDYIRAEAERMAQATPVQSGAQGIIKRVMRAVWPVLRSLRPHFWIEPLLQVHDALDLEYDTEHRDVVNTIMTNAMTTTVTLRVPIKTSADFGLRLGEL